MQSHVADPEEFWKLGSEALRQSHFKERPMYPQGFSTVEKQEHPSIIQEFLDNQCGGKYYVREELFGQFKKL